MNGPVVVWRPDVRRYLNEPAYAERVDQLVSTYLPTCSANDAEVREAPDGELALVARSFLTPEGRMWNTDERGNVVQREHFAPLPEGIELP